jgi:PDDEXK-like uncharacterized protein DUF3799
MSSLNPMAGESKNLLTNCKIIGADMKVDDYRRRDPKIARGHPDYVMSNSELLDFASCPARWLRGHESDEGETTATEFGTLVDLLALQPHKTDELLAICPETYTDAKTGEEKPWTFAAKVCKQWREDHIGKQIVKADVYQAAENAAKCLYGDERIKSLLARSHKQVMVVGEYRDAETKRVVPLRGLIDIEPAKDSDFADSLADLKTCRRAAPRPWQKQVFDYGYHCQGSLYLDLYNAATGEARERFLHVLIESDPPWQTGRRFLSLDYLELGRLTLQNALKRYCQCLATNVWQDWDSASKFNGWSIVEPDAWMFQ